MAKCSEVKTWPATTQKLLKIVHNACKTKFNIVQCPGTLKVDANNLFSALIRREYVASESLMISSDSGHSVSIRMSLFALPNLIVIIIYIMLSYNSENDTRESDTVSPRVSTVQFKYSRVFETVHYHWQRVRIA